MSDGKAEGVAFLLGQSSEVSSKGWGTQYICDSNQSYKAVFIARAKQVTVLAPSFMLLTVFKAQYKPHFLTESFLSHVGSLC